MAIRQAWVHCAQAILRSGLWQPPTRTAPTPDGHTGRPRRLVDGDLGTTIATTTPQPMTVEAAGQPVGTGTVEPGQSLLDAGLAAGIDLPFSCTVGTCGECVVRLRRGDVVVSGPNCLTPQQRAAGYTLTCAGQPLSEVAIDLADQGRSTTGGRG
ncbi:2Fe-2S iron-sulfur cluster-binding protein [Micromonospora humida]|uniref:2Fe-2S iron-sulfur cluster binding domain-containing protein n=1 Tax=Micromonospora humida TaxID=2809018 RepID=A0ABS2ISE7_9ACTN|nr:2Fe-2S iron-sulfur cluster binding domain-containing protein [Micromonospora humida]MBM7077262.1 2Fe-2S iron-sulfur cluster binding domain-containing protein [Micromonospora humida]